jgi:F-type H+-transporting ATPase subunit b
MLDNTTWAFVGLVLFLALVAYLGVFRTLGKFLDKRGEAVTDELTQARKLREDAEALLVEYQAKRLDAERAAAEIVAAAEIEATRMTAEARIAVEELIARKTQAVETRIALAETAAVAEVKARAVDIAVAAATDILRRKVKDEVAADLIAKGIAEAKARLN